MGSRENENYEVVKEVGEASKSRWEKILESVRDRNKVGDEDT